MSVALFLGKSDYICLSGEKGDYLILYQAHLRVKVLL